MSIPLIEVLAYFDLGSDDLTFTLDDAVKGKLDSSYVLGGDIATDLASRFSSIRITRGRTSELEQISAGTATVKLRNHDRHLDPLYASSPYAGHVIPGKRLGIVAAGVTISDGTIDDWDFTNTFGSMPYAVIRASDALARLAEKRSLAWTTTAGQTAGERLTAVLNRSEVGFPTNRDIDTGVSTLQADSVSYGSNVLRYCQLVAKSDLGALFASRTGVLTFRDRHAALTATAMVEFRDDGTGTTFHGIKPSYGSEQLHNDIGVDREGGTLQRVTDAVSIARYGGTNRALTITGLLLEDDTQSANMAAFLLSRYKDVHYRIKELTVIVSALDEADHVPVLSLDLAQVIRVVWTPGAPAIGDPIDLYGVIEGIKHDITGSKHTMTLSLSDLDTQAFILDAPDFGALDGDGVLTF